ncbi:methionyl-tRNA formyltransferase [Erysipelothrix urinaevulpis]|uniref:methionyl-tRNA formyltransferase n=1 Tax=Erysipelothrix urinaevulpis TaxID=2683717 RepID=UPI00135A68E7|nr:methionyl-tRNA formyltransferase [Erysipelothrix urinaevulpis]
MRILFMGTTVFSKVILDLLIEEGYDVMGVVTQPDRPFGRKRILKASVVKERALEKGIAVYQPEKIKESIEAINGLGADLIVTCAYGQIVPIEIIEKPKYKAVNVHASLLPKYRGGAPIHWSIIKGENKTGLTLMEMDAGMDSGNMIAKKEVIISIEDTMGDVEAKLMAVAEPLIRNDLKSYLKGEIQSVSQNEHDVSYAYTIQKKDEHINFNQDVMNVYNHIRGLIPWPVSFALLEGERVKFHQVKLVQANHSFASGTIMKVHKEGVDIACEGGYVTITKIQPFGKPTMDAIDFYNGFNNEWEGKVFK